MRRNNEAVGKPRSGVVGRGKGFLQVLSVLLLVAAICAWELILSYQVATTVIEDHGSGTSLIADLTQEGVQGVVGFKPEGDKVIRLHAQTATIAQGFVYLPKAAPWVSAFLHEVTSFPNGKKDDQVDALTQLLAWAKQPDSWRNWMGYMKGELAEQQAKSADSIPVGANIRMQAPPSDIGVTTYLKRHLWLDPDGTGLFTEEETRGLLQLGWSRA